MPHETGGETLQRGGETLTTNHGFPLSDNQDSLKTGSRAPVLLEGFVLREKIFHFDHERIPERIDHARSTGAQGVFECTSPIPELTRAPLLQTKGARSGLRALLDGCRIERVEGHALRREVICGEILHAEGQPGPRPQQHPGLLHQDAMKFPDLVHA